MKSFICTVCGYIHVGEQPPQKCPVCDASSDDFDPVENKGRRESKGTGESRSRGDGHDLSDGPIANGWSCTVCGYIHDGAEAPENCPVCGVKKDMFEPCKIGGTDVQNNDDLKIVIIGSGIAGVSCAEEIRNHSDQAEVTLISKDAQLPYYRLNLTRYLAGETDRESLTIHPLSWYEEKRIGLMTGTEVHGIDKESRRIQLVGSEKYFVTDIGETNKTTQGSSEIFFDKLIIANGAHPFVPPFPGKDSSNVMTVRTLEDIDGIGEMLKETESCICIGGGILGLEAAGAIAKKGVKVTLLEGSEWLMPRQLNRKAAVILKGFIQEMGIEVRENAKVKEILGENSTAGVRLTTGEFLPSKLVIITAGVRPNTHLARKAGLEVNNGLVVDNHMKTSHDHIFAAGDVTEHYGIVYGLWSAAQFQGKIAAQNALGLNAQFGGIPRSSVLKVLGLDMFSIGEFNPADGSSYLYEKEMENGYYCFVVRDGRIIGSIILGDKAISKKVKSAVEKGVHFPHGLFDDVDSILNELMKD